MADAERNHRLGRRTLIFIDEIHRFNKAQQDAFLPYVERGDISLIGATTENPSFELNAALLSRARVLVFRPLDATAVMSKLTIPVLVSHGAEDKNAKVDTAKFTASVIPGAKLSVYDGIGHSPFYEDAPRFNSELAAFVRTANKGN